MKTIKRKYWALACALGLLSLAIPFAVAQTTGTSTPSWLAPAWAQARNIPLLPTILSGQVPATLPQTTTLPDLTGKTSTYFVNGPVTTSSHSFFTPLGTNGRSCFTCHQPETNWSVTPLSILGTYLLTQGKDPIFAPVDGADCPNAGAAAPTAGVKFILARSQLFTRGNFRIFIPEPTNHDWVAVTASQDPTGCEMSAVYGLGATPAMASMYRRPLPATNVIFTTPGVVGPVPNIMWDAREKSLSSQFNDATLTHAQAAVPPTASEIADGVAFQSQSFTAQSYDLIAQDLTGADGSGAMGGPLNLYDYALTVPPGNPFGPTTGPVCPSGQSPCPGSLFPSPTVPGGFVGFTTFNAFTSASGTSASAAQRESIARGQALFNNHVFQINGVTGLNDIGFTGGATLTQPGTCSTCHGNTNVGNDAFLDPKHLGIGDNSTVSAQQASSNGKSTLPITPDFPVFTFLCPVGSIGYFSNPVVWTDGKTYDKFQTTDPGVGWVDGSCADLGKFKVPSLRGVGARPPFFHGGEAATMRDVIVFYNNRFNMNLGTQDINDLVNFMNSL